MGQCSIEKSCSTGSVLSGNQPPSDHHGLLVSIKNLYDIYNFRKKDIFTEINA